MVLSVHQFHGIGTSLCWSVWRSGGLACWPAGWTGCLAGVSPFPSWRPPCHFPSRSTHTSGSSSTVTLWRLKRWRIDSVPVPVTRSYLYCQMDLNIFFRIHWPWFDTVFHSKSTVPVRYSSSVNAYFIAPISNTRMTLFMFIVRAVGCKFALAILQ